MVGTGAALCSMTSFVPQIVKIVRERDASSVSLRMYAVTVTGFALWIAYGVMTHAWPVTGANTVCLRALGDHPGAEMALLRGLASQAQLRLKRGPGARPRGRAAKADGWIGWRLRRRRSTRDARTRRSST